MVLSEEDIKKIKDLIREVLDQEFEERFDTLYRKKQQQTVDAYRMFVGD